MHEKNSLAKKSWQTIITMKDSLLLDSGLLLEFWAETMGIANFFTKQVPNKKSEKRAHTGKSLKRKKSGCHLA